MKPRFATEVTQVFPKWNNKEQWMATEHYKVGAMAPVYPYGYEKVKEIEIIFTPQLMAEITFEDYGSVLITDYITEIRFVHERYEEIRGAKEAAARHEGSGGQPKGSNQNR